MIVRVLPDSIVNRIAAGEVVERPASVVRELVDNALDAGAADVAVYLENGGHSLIRVVDDGCGMERDDAVLAFERHATSKISSESDLMNLTTLGFRGEALPSIAAVSKIRLKTGCRGAEIGHEVVIEGGRLVSVREIPGIRGTDISVQHLFFNTPARRKFLKSVRAEELRVKTWLQQSAIPHSDTRFRLFIDGREVVNLPRRENQSERAAAMYKGATLAFARRFPIRLDGTGETGETAIHVHGLIAHPSMAQADAGAFVILVNNRLINDRALVRAVKDGFDSTLKDREFPQGFMHLELPGSLVDVNVHPQKSEVRFWDQRILFGLVRDLVYQTVQHFRMPETSLEVPSWPVQERSVPFSTEYAASGPAQSLFAAEPAPGLLQSGNVEEPAPRLFSDIRYIGQLFGCYLLCEAGDDFVVVDMHAAHERYNFNLIRNRVLSRDAVSQALLIPQKIELTEEGIGRLLEHEDLLKRFGFEAERAGETSLVLRAAPSMLDADGSEAVIKEMAASDLEGEAFGMVKGQIDAVSARIACHASVRSGAQLTREEVYALFSALDSTEFSMACPHGRPVAAAFSRSAVEKWFGRDR